MLLDVGVWLAAVWSGHVHHVRVARWFDSATGDFIFCRITQMSLLRLLSSSAVMGNDVLARADTWKIFDRLRADDRVRWVAEPVQLEHAWRAISARVDTNHKLWTDDYLAAFAQTAGFAIATLDNGFERRYPSVTIITPA